MIKIGSFFYHALLLRGSGEVGKRKSREVLGEVHVQWQPPQCPNSKAQSYFHCICKCSANDCVNIFLLVVALTWF